MIVILASIAVFLLGGLMFSADGYQKTVQLREAVNEQQEMNEQLRARNLALDAEVMNLKQGREAAEERARTDLGLIGENETFYQVVSVARDPN
ncbi:MAG TPA: septum formation initiator family protein [Woeseiaceae bacterium]|nr:septum formation initiator family protein [Woeseiaceae bacterium]